MEQLKGWVMELHLEQQMEQLKGWAMELHLEQRMELMMEQHWVLQKDSEMDHR